MSKTKSKTAPKTKLAKAKSSNIASSKAKPKAAASNKSKVKSTAKSTAVKKAKEDKKTKTATSKEKSVKKKKETKVAKANPAPNKNKTLAKKEKTTPDKKSKKDSKDGVLAIQRKHEGKAGKSKRGRKKKGSGDDDDEPMLDLADDLLLKDILETVKPNKKNQKEKKQIRTFVNPIASLNIAQEAKKKISAKEPKGKFELEFVLGTSPGILYEFLSTPSGLSEWFADDVNIRDGVFTFFWDGTEQKALLLDFKEEKFIRFQWLDKPEGSYFEFKIEIDDLTNDVSLIVTDFADEASDLETSKRLWDSQIHTLMHVIGSY
jgi:uncharacterized protein YndB with AHSA1/START domain